MSDPQPDSPPTTTDPSGAPAENPSGSADAVANQVDPQRSYIDPTGG